MKKKIKLFTTIASLCLAVALMAFGVYAATQVTYNVNGTVQYTMDAVLVDVSTTIEKSDLKNAPADFTAAALEAHVDVDWVDAGFTVTAGNYQTYDEDTKLADDTKKDVTLDNIVYDFAESSVYKVTVTVTNHNDTGIKFTKAGLNGTNATVAEDANYQVVAAADNQALNTTAAKGATSTFVYYIAIEDLTINIDAVAANFQFAAEKA